MHAYSTFFVKICKLYIYDLKKMIWSITLMANRGDCHNTRNKEFDKYLMV